MKKMSLTDNRGFSLIELSIVLIIIGLLVAGITGGASLIKSAELRSVMSEARSYKIAVNAYYTSQDFLPGDDPTSTSGTESSATDEGDNDGFIEAVGDTAHEGMEAWNDMSDDDIGVLDIGDITLPGTKGTVSPALGLDDMGPSKHKTGGWTFDYSTTGIAVGDDSSSPSTQTANMNSNSLIFTAATSAGSGTATVPVAVLKYSEVLSIDSKMDDGVVSTGSLYGGLATCISGNTNVTCSIYINLDL